MSETGTAHRTREANKNINHGLTGTNHLAMSGTNTEVVTNAMERPESGSLTGSSAIAVAR